MNFRLKVLLLALACGTCCTQAASVNFDIGGGTSAVLFETSDGSALVGGYLFAGTFSTMQSVGIGISDVISDYEVFDVYLTQSQWSGNFTSGSFSGDVEPDHVGQQIYLVVTDAPTFEAATEFAVLTSTDPSWFFPADDGISPSANITLPDVNQVLAGSNDTIEDPGGVSGTFASIQLTQIPEPSSILLLAAAGAFALMRRQRP